MLCWSKNIQRPIKGFNLFMFSFRKSIMLLTSEYLIIYMTFQESAKMVNTATTSELFCSIWKVLLLGSNHFLIQPRKWLKLTTILPNNGRVERFKDGLCVPIIFLLNISICVLILYIILVFVIKILERNKWCFDQCWCTFRLICFFIVGRISLFRIGSFEICFDGLGS